MTNKSTISFVVKGMKEDTFFSVPADWNDRKIVSKMMKAYDNFAITTEGAKLIAEKHDKAAKVVHYTDPSTIDTGSNPYATNPDWYILLTHTPARYFEEVGIEPVSGENVSDVHVVRLLDEEINMPLDEYRLSIVKTIGNYHITRRFIVGTPDECDLCDESFYQRWYFELEFEDLNEYGFIGYDIEIVDDTKPYEYPEEEIFFTLEEAEEFIRSVQES